MDTLSDAERILCDAVEAGQPAVFEGPVTIRASTIRSIVLKLPFADGRDRPHSPEQKRYVLSPTGVSVTGAQIEGRLDLRDCGRGDANSCALNFCNCLFVGGFSGAGGCFGPIAFEDCRFRDAPAFSALDGALEIPASIDLEGAHISGRFVARNVHGDRQSDHMFINAREARIGGTIDLSRSRLKALPRRVASSVDRNREAALDLCLARIEGDLSCLRGFSAVGGIMMRSAHVFGDVWLLGSEIRGREAEDAEAHALFMQGIVIDGNVTLSGWANNQDGSGGFRAFEATGDLNFLSAKIAGGFYLTDFILQGNVDLRQASVGAAISIGSSRIPYTRVSRNILAQAINCTGDIVIGVQVDGVVDLSKCRIGGSLDISELRLAPSNATAGDDLRLDDGNIDGALRLLIGDEREARLIKAREQQLESLPGNTLVETLWQFEQNGVSATQTAQIGFIRNKDFAVRLDGQAGRLHKLVKQNGHSVDSWEHAAEYLRLFCAYLQTANGSFPIMADRNTLPPLAQIDHEAIEENLDRIEAGLDGDEAGRKSALQRALQYRELGDLPEDMFAFTRVEGPKEYVEVPDEVRHFHFEACVLYNRDLFRALLELRVIGPRVLSIEMLGDKHTGVILKGVPVLKGAFTYPPVELGKGTVPAFLTRPALPNMSDVGTQAGESLLHLAEQLSPHVQSNNELRGKVNLDNLKCGFLKDYGGSSWGDSVRIAMNSFVYGSTQWKLPALRKNDGLKAQAKTLAIDYAPRSILWFMERSPDRFRNRSRSAWRVRRDWLYQQFQPGGMFVLNPSRLEITDEDYQPQPFEQIIRVSRSEGHEEYATRFEIEKKNIEWRLIRRRLRPAFLLFALLATLLTLVGGMAILEITKWRLFLTLLAAASVYALTRLVKAGASFARPGRLNPLASLPEQKRRALLENRQLFMALLAVNWQLRQHSDDKALLDRKRELEAALAARANPSIRKDMRHLRWRAFVEAARHGPGLPTIALVLVTGWMLTRSAGDLALLLAWSGAVALVVIYLPDAVNLIMRFGFGYLRRPFRALVTLALVMLAGWWGVATANEARMLVVSVTPVATLVGEANGQIAIGGQLVPVTPSTNIATNVQCGDTISEPLYALDVLIPLIDLHQESLCEVAIAELPKLNRNLHQGSFDTVVHSTTFWLVAKAAYAILGWIVISLTILTFVRVFRTGEAN